MYKIIKNEEVIATQSALQWVKRQENGVFVRSTQVEAHGVLVGDTIFIIRGQEPVEGYELVDVVEVQTTAASDGDRLGNMEAQLADIAAAVERGLA